ncbi:XK-related protein 8-like [Megalops cyprinoides]|uniref:XK-related protein 8-like n=1 Tax=Megalops cyprinoides TaxID=118141 RepID=UPI0018651071|nr:XK-related protein 8-like [Megalops cyprinoides]
MERRLPFSYPVPDFLLTLLGLCLFLFDVALDLHLIASLCLESAYRLVTVVVALLLFSSVLVHIFSWLWYSYEDPDPETRIEHFLRRYHLLGAFHFFQLGVFIRYAAVMEISGRSFREKCDWLEGLAVYHTHDLSMLRLFETFLESAPQLVLMIYIIIHKGELGLLSFFKAGGSAASIAWSVAMYHRSLRSFLPDKDKQGWGSSVVYFLWNLLLIAPRMAALALFASSFPCYVAAHFLLLWVALFLWAWLQRTDFMDSVCGELLYRAVVGIIWYFSWFNVAKGDTFMRSAIHHAFIMVDSGLLLWLWWERQDSVDKPLVEPCVVFSVIASSFVLGLLLKITYYKCFHPKNPRLQTVSVFLTEAQSREGDTVDSRDSPVVMDRSIGKQMPPVRANKRMRNLAANFYSPSQERSEIPLHTLNIQQLSFSSLLEAIVVHNTRGHRDTATTHEHVPPGFSSVSVQAGGRAEGPPPPWLRVRISGRRHGDGVRTVPFPRGMKMEMVEGEAAVG